MEAVKNLFRKFRKREVEKAAAGFPEYNALLLRLAKGHEVDDPKGTQLLLEALGKTEADVAADAQTMAKRLQAAEAHRKHAEAGQLVADTESTMNSVAGEMEAFKEQWTPRMDAATIAHREARAQWDSTSWGERALRETCLDPVILNREAELAEQYAPLGERLREAQDKRADLARYTASYEKAAESAKEDEERYRHSEQWAEKYKREHKQAKERLQAHLDRVSALDSEIAELQQQRRDIDAERAELNQRKMAV